MEPRLLFAQVCAAGASGTMDAGSFVRIYNASSTPDRLGGWVLEWGSASLVFPGYRQMESGDAVVVAWDAAAYQRAWGRLPDYAVKNGADAVPVLAALGAPEPLHTSAGQVRLLSAWGVLSDVFVWGDAPATVDAGWTGPTLSFQGPGSLFQRAVDEATLGPDSPGSYVTASGVREAWWQGSDWISRRQARVGQNPLPYPAFKAGSAVAFAMPDSAFETIAALIDGAQQSLDINLYIFTQTDLFPYLEAAVKRGVEVRLLIEGEPVDGMRRIDWDNMLALGRAGVQVRRLAAATSDGYKRYKYNHAKYAVADGRRSLVMSDNWTHHSVPSSPKLTQRGWGIVVEDEALAAYLTEIFTQDYNPASPDSQPCDASTRPTAEDEEPPADDAPELPLTHPFPSQRFEGELKILPAQAPEYALLETCGSTRLMRAATRTLDIQQLTVPLHWGPLEGGSPESTPNLFLAEAIAAARRGVRVRISMDGAYLHPTDPRDNTHTRDYINVLAQQEGLPLEARILDYKATGLAIHNKGLVVDGSSVLISSINWSQNSPLFNREVGLVIEHPGVAAYFTVLFERDWESEK